MKCTTTAGPLQAQNNMGYGGSGVQNTKTKRKHENKQLQQMMT